jgi:hypothetical protein
MHEDNGVCTGAYYTAGKKRTGGYGLPVMHLDSVEIVENATDYTSQWQGIANSMRKHNINLDVADSIEKHLRGETEHINGFQNYWKKTDKPRTMSFKDVTGGMGIEQLRDMATPSQYTGGALHYHASKCGQRRDRSVSLTVKPDGRINFTSASEYAGCGNGDYYCMYSPTMAFYAETD